MVERMGASSGVVGSATAVWNTVVRDAKTTMAAVREVRRGPDRRRMRLEHSVVFVAVLVRATRTGKTGP